MVDTLANMTPSLSPVTQDGGVSPFESRFQIAQNLLARVVPWMPDTYPIGQVPDPQRYRPRIGVR